MKTRNLLILSIMAIVLVVSVIVSRKEEKTPVQEVGKTLFPDLEVNEAGKIVIQTAETTSTVERTEEEWVCRDHYDYPADFNRIRDALLNIADLKIGQVMRVGKEEKANLQIVPPEEASTPLDAAIRVDLFSRSGEKMADLLLGKVYRKREEDPSRMGGYPAGRYISPDNGKTVYLVDETLDRLVPDSYQWLDKDILNVPSKDITEISITGPDRDPIHLVREGADGDFQLQDLRRKEKVDRGAVERVASALQYLRYTELPDPSLSEEETGLDSPVVFTATTRQGGVYTLRIGGSPENSNKTYVKVSVEWREPAPEQQPESAENEEPSSSENKDEAKDLQITEQQQRETRREIANLNRKLSRWLYLLRPYHINTLLTKREALIQNEKESDKD